MFRENIILYLREFAGVFPYFFGLPIPNIEHMSDNCKLASATGERVKIKVFPVTG